MNKSLEIITHNPFDSYIEGATSNEEEHYVCRRESHYSIVLTNPEDEYMRCYLLYPFNTEKNESLAIPPKKKAIISCINNTKLVFDESNERVVIAAGFLPMDKKTSSNKKGHNSIITIVIPDTYIRPKDLTQSVSSEMVYSFIQTVSFINKKYS